MHPFSLVKQHWSVNLKHQHSHGPVHRTVKTYNSVIKICCVDSSLFNTVLYPALQSRICN